MKRESEKSNENNDSTKKQKLNDAELSKQMEAVRKRWDSSATFFRTQVEITTSQTMYTLLTWLEVSKMSAGQKILEVGCGSGAGLLLISSQLDPSVEVHGVDVSPEMIKHAKEQVESNWQTKNRKTAIQTNVTDGITLPFPDHHFDRLVANYVAHITPDAVQFMNECRRVLKPGGIAAFSVWGRPENSSWFNLTEVVKQNMGVKTTLNPAYHLGDKETMKNLSKQIGFKSCQTFYNDAAFICHETEDFVKYIMAFKPPGNEIESEFESKLRKELQQNWLGVGNALSSEILNCVCYN